MIQRGSGGAAGEDAEPFIGLRPASALRRLTDNLCQAADFRLPAVTDELRLDGRE